MVVPPLAYKAPAAKAAGPVTQKLVTDKESVRERKAYEKALLAERRE